MIKISEISAYGTQGFLIFDCFNGTPYFRIYDKLNKNGFIDYLIKHDDLKIEIIDNYSSLNYYKLDNGEDEHTIDYHSKEFREQK